MWKDNKKHMTETGAGDDYMRENKNTQGSQITRHPDPLKSFILRSVFVDVLLDWMCKFLKAGAEVL